MALFIILFAITQFRVCIYKTPGLFFKFYVIPPREKFPSRRWIIKELCVRAGITHTEEFFISPAAFKSYLYFNLLLNHQLLCARPTGDANKAGKKSRFLEIRALGKANPQIYFTCKSANLWRGCVKRNFCFTT